MVDITDKHFRYFCRLLTKKAYLYTEMITSKGIIHGDRKNLLDFNTLEKPVVLQIAGCDQKEVAEAVKIAEDWDYDEINLNVGCPSDKISSNKMGAALMAHPELVAEMVDAMGRETKKPISVKHRIGIRGEGVAFEKYEDMECFVRTVSQAGANHFIIHARIAILEGLSPKDNRQIPPLRYDEIYRLKKEYPQLFIEINGGIRTTEAIKEHLQQVDGVMLGRVAYEDSFMLTKVDQFCSGGGPNIITRKEIIEGLIDYIVKIEREEGREASFNTLKSTLSLFHNKRGSRKWRQLLSPPWRQGMGPKEVLREAIESLPEDVLEETPSPLGLT